MKIFFNINNLQPYKYIRPAKRFFDNKALKNGTNDYRYYANDLLNILSFESNKIASENFSQNELFKEFVSAKGKVSVNEYKNIKNSNPEIFNIAREFTDYKLRNNPLHQEPLDTAMLVRSSKEKFDNQFGKNNYVIISIGTSPAFLTEGMSALDADVIFVPISGVSSRRQEEQAHDYFKNCPRVENVAGYIKEELSKRKIQDGVNIVVMDYVISGRTLKLIQQILEQYCEIPKSQIYECNIKQHIKNIVDLNTFRVFPRGFNDDILDEKVYQIANVPHYNIAYHGKYIGRGSYYLDMESERNKYKEFENYSNPLGRAYQLLVLYELDRLVGIG